MDASGEVAEIAVEEPAPVTVEARSEDYLDAAGRARAWACEAVKLAGLVGKKTKRQSDADYQRQIETEADRLIRRVVATGEFYLVRTPGNVRKGTGTFYTRPQLAVPTTHRTLEPLCYVVDGEWWMVGGGKQEMNDAGSELSRSGSVAKGDGSGHSRIPGDEAVSAGGTLRADQPGFAELRFPCRRTLRRDRGDGQPGSFLHHLSIARGSLLEAQTQIEIARRLEFLNDVATEALDQLLTSTLRLLNALVNALERKLEPPEPPKKF